MPLTLLPWLKRARDAAGDAVAGAVLRVPRLERAYVAVGKRVHRLPGLDGLYRRSFLTLLPALSRREGIPFRRLDLGPARVWGDVRHFTFGTLFFKGTPYEPLTAAAVAAGLRPGGTFVDVGANAGYFSLLAAALVGPSGRVAAFEPNPATAALLRAHAERNGSGGTVSVEPVALMDEDGEMELYLSTSRHNDGLSTFFPSEEALRRGDLDRAAVVRVPARRYDAWAAEANFPAPDVVKIDVEGAEEEVLRGMAGTLEASPPPRIVCETRWMSPAHRLLLERGYRAERLEFMGPEFGNVLFTLPAGGGGA